jgi:hypothetical protein
MQEIHTMLDLPYLAIQKTLAQILELRYLEMLE